MTLNDIVNEFEITGKAVNVKVYGMGLINETYLVTAENKGKEYFYILQKINSTLFKDITSLMSNIKEVTEFFAKQADKACIKTINLLKTKNGENIFVNKAGAYRMYHFIEGNTLETLNNNDIFTECGKAYGCFQNMLSGFDASSLNIILPDFHNTEKRFGTFINSLKNDKYSRAYLALNQIDFVEKRKDYCTKITKDLISGKLPVKVIHGDTKLNNVLFNKNTDKALAVIDLDTVMAGAACYDFGDSIRSGLLRAEFPLIEDKFKLYESYAKGFLSTCNKLNQAELNSLALGSIIITYECGMRFLTDYLDGDVYFKTAFKGQNLEKAINNFNLLIFLENNYDKLQNITKNLTA
jgi:Ser/Thr protein kinase RdoA (MazF antagonist)